MQLFANCKYGLSNKQIRYNDSILTSDMKICVLVILIRIKSSPISSLSWLLLYFKQPIGALLHGVQLNVQV